MTPAEYQLPERVRKSIPLFAGREWLLPRLVEWWDHGEQRLFLITGDPGTGKSMVMSWLAGFGPEPDDPTARAHLARLRGVTKAVHFCQASSRNITPQDFAQNVSAQLARTVAPFRDALAAMLEDRLTIIGKAEAGTAEAGASLIGVEVTLNLAGLGEESSFDRGLIQPLKRLYERGHQEPLLLIVDGLDEAQVHADALLPRLLSQHADWPRPVRILATTRAEPRILKFFRALPPLDLVKDAKSSVDDIQSYVDDIQSYAERRLLDAPLDEPKRRDFAGRLAEKSKGIFLYAALVLDPLLETPTTEFPDLDALLLPKDLRGIYHNYLTRELGKDDERWYGLYEPLLGLIAVAQGDGLTAGRLTDIIGKDIRAALRASKQYLAGELPDGPFRPFHKSFSDFLFEEKVDYHVDAKVWHGRVVDYYLKKYSKDWRSCDDYGLNSLAAHMSAAGRIGELVGLIDQRWMQVRFERSDLTYAAFQSDLELAYQAAMTSPDIRIDHLVRLKAVGYAIQENIDAYEDDDLGLMVQLGRSAQAVAHVRLRKDPEQRFRGSVQIMTDLPPDAQTVLSLAEEARKSANAIGDRLDRVRCLCSLATTMKSSSSSPVATQILHDAQQFIAEMRDEGQWAQAQRELASTFAALDRLDEASAVALAIGDAVQQAFALKDVAIGYAEAGQLDTARSLANDIKPDTTPRRSDSAIWRIHAEALAEIACVQDMAKDPDAAADFKAAELACADAPEEHDRSDALWDLAMALMRSGRLAESQRVARSIQDWRRDYALAELVRAQAAIDAFDNASALLNEIKTADWLSIARVALTCELARAGRYQEARSLLRRLRDEPTRVRALLGIADALVASNDRRARATLDEALERAQALTGKDRHETLRRLVHILIRAGDTHRAAAIFGQIQAEQNSRRDPRQLSDALREMGVALARIPDARADHLFERARLNVRRVDAVWRGQAKRDLARSLSETGRLDGAWEILEETGTEEWERYTDWAGLAARLSGHDDERAELALAKARGIIAGIGNDTARDEALVALSASLAEQRRFAMMEEVAMRVKSSGLRCEVLSSLASALHKIEPNRSRELFVRAERTARSERFGFASGEPLAGLVRSLGEVSQFGDALRIAASIADDSERIAALSDLAARLAMAGDSRGVAMFDEALRVTGGDGVPEHWPEIEDMRSKAADLEAEGDPAAKTLWHEANKRAGSLWTSWMWSEPQYRAEFLVRITAGLGRAEDARWSDVLDMARAAALKVSFARTRDEKLVALAKAMIAVDRLDAARAVLADIRDEDQRLSAIRSLVEAFAKARQAEAALRVARLVSSDYERRELMRQAAIALARENLMAMAIEALEETTLDGFIGAISAILAAWTNPPPQAISQALSAITSVAAWVRSDWDEIATLLQA